MAREWEREFLGYTFRVVPGKLVQSRVAPKAWENLAHGALNTAMPKKCLEGLELLRLAPIYLNFPNRRMRSLMSGSVEGVQPGSPTTPDPRPGAVYGVAVP